MKKIILGCLAATTFASGVNAAPKSYSSLEFGFETITYREDISVLGQDLSQDSKIINPIQHTVAYTALDNAAYGFYLESTSTLFENYETEEWSLGGYGPIQTNDLLMSSIDVKVLSAYNMGDQSQFLMGVSLFVLDFTRSSLARPSGGKSLHDDIVAGNYDNFHSAEQVNDADCDADGPGDGDDDGEKGFCMSEGSISESQNSIELLLGYHYDSNLGLSNKFSWYAQGEFALPIWHRTTNSNFQGVTLDDFGGGWGLNARAGMRWSVTENFNLSLGAAANYKVRDQIDGTRDDGGSISVPNVEYTNIQFMAGLMWYL